MTKGEEKEFILYSFFNKNGFEHTFEAIAHNLQLTQRTLIYRYGSKEEMFDSVMNYWRKNWYEQFVKHKKNSNHAVEELLMYMCLPRECYEQSEPFFLREIEKKDFFNSDLPYNFLTPLATLISAGTRHGYFENIDNDFFSKLLLFNVLHFFILEKFPLKNITYLLSSLLSEKGKEQYENMDTLHFLDKNYALSDR